MSLKLLSLVRTEGSQTRLHRDAYGWNCVCQLYGRKRWRLWPKSASILATRVPYEESTIWGFESPDVKNEVLDFCLAPGEMLIIPPGWWHHVRSLDLSVSINIWSANETTDKYERNTENTYYIIQFIL